MRSSLSLELIAPSTASLLLTARSAPGEDLGSNTPTICILS